MLFRTLTVILLFGLPFLGQGQLADGSYAPNFTLDDINGVTHDLHSYLDQGYSVVLDMSATWCGPCWSYHTTGILEDLYEDFGPGGTDQVMVFMIEADPNTGPGCVYGPSQCTGSYPVTIGDWTAGVNYPIISPPSGPTQQINNDYNINYFPTLYGVAPNQQIFEIGQASYNTWANWLVGSFQLSAEYEVITTVCELSAIDLMPSAGYGTLEYQWSSGQTTEDLSGIPSGEYFVTITDDNNWSIVVGPIEVEGLDIFVNIEEIEVGDLLCFEDFSGFIEIEADGGLGDYDYLWSNGDAGALITDLESGYYDVTVTDLDSGCTNEASYFVDEPDVLESSFSTGVADCDGLNGSVYFSTDGGTEPYVYDFGALGQWGTDVVNGLPAGEYMVTVIDANNCTLVLNIDIGQLDDPVADAASLGVFDCYNDPVYVFADSSSMGSHIAYLWYDTLNVLIDTGYQVQVDSPAIYILNVVNTLSGCVTSAMTMVMQDTLAPSVSLSTSNEVLNCYNPTAMLSGSGTIGDTSLSILWTTDNGLVIPDSTSNTITVDAPGTYTFTVTDTINGCASTASVLIEDSTSVGELTIMDFEICEGEELLYSLDVNGLTEITWYVDSVFIGSGTTVELPPGIVLVEATDVATGCPVSATFEISVLSLHEIVIDDVYVCENTSASASISGDFSMIEWFANGVLIGSGMEIDTLPQGVITVLVTDFNGCLSTGDFTVFYELVPEFTIIPPEHLTCETTSVHLSAVLIGNAELTGQWADHLGNVLALSTDVVVSLPGLYTFTAISPLGCVASQTVEVILDDIILPESAFTYLQDDLQLTFVNEASGDIDSILWTFGDGAVSNEFEPEHSFAESGYYNVCLTVSNSCGEATTCEVILVTTPIQVSAILSDVSCFGYNDGAISVTISGGLPGYVVSWSGPGGFESDKLIIENLGPGEYQIEIHDEAGAIMTGEYLVEEPLPLSMTGEATPADHGQSNGILVIHVTGGTGQYFLNGLAFDSILVMKDLGPGEYVIEVFDENGCSMTGVYTVSETTRVNNINDLEAIRIYPNPARTMIAIELEAEVPGSYKVDLLSIDGQVHKNAVFSGQQVRGQIDVRLLPEGIYLLRVRNADILSLAKIIIAR